MDKQRPTWTMIVLGPFLAIAGLVAAGQAPDGKSRADELLAFAKGEAAAHTFRLVNPDRPVILQPEPVLKWSNPIVGENYGAVFLGILNGRPAVVYCLHRWFGATDHRPHEAVEYLSLSSEPIVAAKDGQPVWTPSRPGVLLKPIPDAPVPAESRAQRLRQIRELAKDFTGRQTNRKGVEHDMRLLTQPVYRYEGIEAPQADGALFTFAQGTDPEVLLLIEAREVGGKLEWQYGLGRMTSVELKISYRGNVVWTVPVQSWDEVQDRREPYMSFVMR